MNSEKTPFSKQKKKAPQEKNGKRKAPVDHDDTPKEKSSKKKLNFGNTSKADDDLGVDNLSDGSGPSGNLRSRRRLRYTKDDQSHNEEMKKLRQQYREKIGPNWRYYVRCHDASSDEDDVNKHPLPPGASGTYIRYHLVNNGSDIVGVREYY